MKRAKYFVVCLAAAMLLAGCGGGGASGGAEQGAFDMPAASGGSTADFGENESMGWDRPSGDYLPQPEGWDAQESLSQSGSSIYQNPGAKLIRRAELDIQTEQFDQSVAALNQLAAGCGGYFERAAVYSGGYRDAYASRQGEYIVRIPAEQYSRFLQSAGELGYVTNSTESSEDVGEQYYDTESRLKTQRTKQERLLALLEQAASMEDIIALENALTEVEYQIEQYTSTLNRYDALIGFSTFTICLYEVGQVTPEVGETASLGQRMAAGVQASFRDLVQGSQEVLVWVSYHLVLTALLAGAAVAAVVVSRRELARNKKTRKDGGEPKR